MLGMSSSQLTNSIIFRRGRYTTNQNIIISYIWKPNGFYSSPQCRCHCVRCAQRISMARALGEQRRGLRKIPSWRGFDCIIYTMIFQVKASAIYIYIFIYTYTYLYIYIFIHIHIYTHIYIYIHIHIYVYGYIYIYIYIHIYIHIYIYIYIYLYIYIYIFIHIHIYIYISIYKYLCIYMYFHHIPTISIYDLSRCMAIYIYISIHCFLFWVSDTHIHMCIYIVWFDCCICWGVLSYIIDKWYGEWCSTTIYIYVCVYMYIYIYVDIINVYIIYMCMYIYIYVYVYIYILKLYSYLSPSRARIPWASSKTRFHRGPDLWMKVVAPGATKSSGSHRKKTGGFWNGKIIEKIGNSPRKIDEHSGFM